MVQAMSAFPETGRSDTPKMIKSMVRFRPTTGHCLTSSNRIVNACPSGGKSSGNLLDASSFGLPHYDLNLQLREIEFRLYTRLPERTKTPQIGPADSNGIRTEREGFEDIRPAPKTAVHERRYLT